MDANHSLRLTLIQYLEGLHRAGVEQIGRPAALAAPLPLLTAAIPPSGSLEPIREVVSHMGDAKPALPQVSPPSYPAPLATPSSTSQVVEMPPRKPVTSPPSGPSKLTTPFAAPPLGSLAERTAALEVLRNEVAACKACKELACTRTQTVFGVGNVRPRVMFFGEAPGADEDKQGEPFVGRAGQLLTDIIKACTWKREEVYIFNALKCRPPDNRTPEDDEIAHCRPFFERQIEIIRPEYIVCVGAIPTKALLETTESIGKMRGKFHNYRGIKVLCTYHPAYLLRNPPAKRLVWDDMKLLLAEMGIELPKK